MAFLGLLAAMLSITLLPGQAASQGAGRLLKVPQDYPSVGAAVAAAHENDFILVSPGTYHEAIHVTTPHLTIRGVDRNAVIMEGDNKLDNGFFVDGANDVEIANMTARNYTQNGFEWDKVTGWRGTYLTAYHNTSYGIYAFRSTVGEFSYSYSSGNGDSGFYIGACFDCKAIITNIHAAYNGLGYSGTNAGGILIKDSEWDNNMVGLAPNTLHSEDALPQGGKVGNVITNNYVHDNNNTGAPSTFQLAAGVGSPLGYGIEVAGGWNNQLIRNRIVNHLHSGIVLHYLETPTIGNMVQFNDVSRSTESDVAWDGIGAKNCFDGNTDGTGPASTNPPNLETTNSCGTVSSPLGGNPEVGIRAAMSAAGITDTKKETGQPTPGAMSSMADPCAGAPAGCAPARTVAAAAPPVNVAPANQQPASPDGYTPVKSISQLGVGLTQKPTVDDVNRAMAVALANLRGTNLTVDVPSAKPDYNGYAAAAMGMAALFLLVGAALGFWRHHWMPAHQANFPGGEP